MPVVAVGARRGAGGLFVARGRARRRVAAAAFVPFEGPHQAGITALPIPEQGLVASFNVHSQDRAGAEGDAAGAHRGDPRADGGQAAARRGTPPIRPSTRASSGRSRPPDNLSIVVGVGASLFDDRFGLADRKPKELVTMPFLANDRLDPKLSHGDVSIIFEAGHNDTVQFALRQLMRRTRSDLVLRWMIDGYARGIGAGQCLGRRDPTKPAGVQGRNRQPRRRRRRADGSPRLGGPDDGEPEWAVGGSYQAVRIIRMFVEFWDRTQLAEQEALIGRAKVSGAPLGLTDEFDDPDYPEDPDGKRIKLDAHIRLANPRTPETEENLILRRGFNYSRGFDGAGRLDQGLAFIAYQRSLQKGFLTVQSRLKGEPLEEYIMPVGGGFFFVCRGLPVPTGSSAISWSTDRTGCCDSRTESVSGVTAAYAVNLLGDSSASSDSAVAAVASSVERLRASAPAPPRAPARALPPGPVRASAGVGSGIPSGAGSVSACDGQ